MLIQRAQRSHKVIHPDCSAPRMLLLIHRHGWQAPEGLQDRVALLEQRHYAFYGAVHHYRKQPTKQTSIGDLPDSVLKTIACDAEIDFSWTYSA